MPDTMICHFKENTSDVSPLSTTFAACFPKIPFIKEDLPIPNALGVVFNMKL